MSKTLKKLETIDFIQNHTNIVSCSIDDNCLISNVVCEGPTGNQPHSVIKIHDYNGESLPAIFNNEELHHFNFCLNKCHISNLKNMPVVCKNFIFDEGDLDSLVGISKKLDSIIICDAQITDEEKYINLNGLENTQINEDGYFKIFHTKISSLYNFPKVKKLSELIIAGCGLTSLEYLPSLETIEVSFDNNCLQSFKGWDIKTTILRACGNKIKSMKGLKNISNSLSIYNNELENIDNDFDENDICKNFIADDNYISSLKGLKIHPQMLSVCHNELTEIDDDILFDENIKELFIEENPINENTRKYICEIFLRYSTEENPKNIFY